MESEDEKPMKTKLIIIVVLLLLICFQSAWAKTLYRYQREDGVEVTTDLFPLDGIFTSVIIPGAGF
jgi:hypothetical protein